MGYSYGSVALALRGTVEVRMMTATVLTLTAGDAEVFVHLTDEIKEQIRDIVEGWDLEDDEAPSAPIPSGNCTLDHSHAWCVHHSTDHGELWIQGDGAKYVYCPVDQLIVVYWGKPAEPLWGDGIVIP